MDDVKCAVAECTYSNRSTSCSIVFQYNVAQRSAHSACSARLRQTVTGDQNGQARSILPVTAAMDTGKLGDAGEPVSRSDCDSLTASPLVSKKLKLSLCKIEIES